MRFAVSLAAADSSAIIEADGVRVSVLSDRIIRVEKGEFTDKRTQTVMCRNFLNPQFKYVKSGFKLAINTVKCVFCVDLSSLKVGVILSSRDVVLPSNHLNMGGTARTLDGTFGVLGGWRGRREKKDHFCLGHIRKGIFASNGVSELDDSKSFLLNEDGSVSPRNGKCVDKYIFVFEDDYLGGLKEFYMLTGRTPILPKYALSNWWSRYHAYSADEYLALMDEFESKNIPLGVATIDMDWHIVKNVPKDADYHSMQGAGWTGYTFEKSLFPDYKAFLKSLKDRGLAVTMNLHPRDGVRYFEAQYEDMARACGIDPSTKKTVEFDLTDERFLNAYFDILHHPYEADGVDFWWIDWQQGTKSKMKGLDPLWLLNHYHFSDSCRDGRKGIILSRYAGLGSHRYPLGFSGDTVVCWKSLRFQPYFTALASNAGYTWWSHDIGGHLFGRGNEELYLRWLQFGVFSPINRLHSNNKSWSKEPWLYPHVESIAEDFLRLRHRLLPYLYSANVRTSREGVPLVSPMYYYDGHPNSKSKKYRNQYYFGEQLLVSPITKKATERQKGKNEALAKVSVWLPSGEWYDFFTGERVAGGKNCALGGRECEMLYPLGKYPVFAKEGAIVPMLSKRNGNSTSFDELDVKVFVGEGSYTLYDEDRSISFEMKKVMGADGGEAEKGCAADQYNISAQQTADESINGEIDGARCEAVNMHNNSDVDKRSSIAPNECYELSIIPSENCSVRRITVIPNIGWHVCGAAQIEIDSKPVRVNIIH